MLAAHSQRLPSLQTNAFREDADFAAAHPGIVLTATSRYRNDPYRVDVRVPFIPARPSDFSAPPAPQTDSNSAVSALLPVRTLRGSRHTLPALPPTDSRKRAAKQAQHQQQQQQLAQVPPPMATPLTSNDADIGIDAPQPDRKVALIKYKRTHLSASYDPTVVSGLSVGSIVIVQGDRGEHIATVVSAHLAKPKSIPTNIIRLATGDDLLQFQRVQDEETVALEACRAHATRLGLDSLMRIEDVEFQLDFQKLTIFFQSLRDGVFVDFRNLQRALYQHFRCRIWIVDC